MSADEIIAAARAGMSSLTESDARDLIELIRGDLIGLAEKIREAYERRAWIPLGYGSWQLMCQHEFGGGLSLPTGKRREVVAELTGAGMSQRAIAGALGVGAGTVSRDQSTAPNGAVDRPANVIGLDGRRRPLPKPKPIVDPAPPPPIDRQARAQARMSAALDALRIVVGETEPDHLRGCWLSTRQNLRSELRAALHLLDETKRDGE